MPSFLNSCCFATSAVLPFNAVSALLPQQKPAFTVFPNIIYTYRGITVKYVFTAVVLSQNSALIRLYCRSYHSTCMQPIIEKIAATLAGTITPRIQTQYMQLLQQPCKLEPIRTTQIEHINIYDLGSDADDVRTRCSICCKIKIFMPPESPY